MNQFLISKSAVDCGLQIGKNVHVLNDINVSEGAIFYPQNGSARFDVIVVPFSEYVTSSEYLAYKHFVANGGTLVLTDASNFHVKVKYNSTTGTETLVEGHGWAFNGRSAWHNASSPWRRNNTNWVGSTFCCFHRFNYSGAKVNAANVIGRVMAREFGDNVSRYYYSHEENSVTNMTSTSIVATFAKTSNTLVASYIHGFRRGSVVCLCVFGSDMISYSKSTQYFLLLAIISAKLGTSITCPDSVIPLGSSVSCTAKVTGWNPTGTISWSSRGTGSVSFSTSKCFLSSGTCSVTITGSNVGSPTMIATFAGDSSNVPSSGTSNLTVSK